VEPFIIKFTNSTLETYRIKIKHTTRLRDDDEKPMCSRLSNLTLFNWDPFSKRAPTPNTPCMAHTNDSPSSRPIPKSAPSSPSPLEEGGGKRNEQPNETRQSSSSSSYDNLDNNNNNNNNNHDDSKSNHRHNNNDNHNKDNRNHKHHPSTTSTASALSATARRELLGDLVPRSTKSGEKGQEEDDARKSFHTISHNNHNHNELNNELKRGDFTPARRRKHNKQQQGVWRAIGTDSNSSNNNNNNNINNLRTSFTSDSSSEEGKKSSISTDEKKGSMSDDDGSSAANRSRSSSTSTDSGLNGTRKSNSIRELLVRGNCPGGWREVLHAKHRPLNVNTYRWSSFFYLFGGICIYPRWIRADAVSVSIPGLSRYFLPLMFAAQSFFTYQADVKYMGTKSWYHLADALFATFGLVLTFILGSNSLLGMLFSCSGIICAYSCLAVSKNMRANKNMDGFFFWHTIWHAASTIYIMSMCELAMYTGVTFTDFQLCFVISGVFFLWFLVCWSRVVFNKNLKKQVSFSLDEKQILVYSQTRKDENRRSQRWKKYQRMLKYR